MTTRLYCGDAVKEIKKLGNESVHLIVTSPPYADQRKSTYGGIHADDYVERFMPIAAELKRVLKRTGTLMLNIKERVVAGERHPYALELILAMRQQGWLWTEEMIWHKKSCYPGKWPNAWGVMRWALRFCASTTTWWHGALRQLRCQLPGNWCWWNSACSISIFKTGGVDGGLISINLRTASTNDLKSTLLWRY